MTDARIVLSTVDLHETAMAIARALVEARLAACVNVAPAVESTYWWKGKIEHSLEYVMLMKTTENKLDALRERLLELHPYDVPEVVVLGVEGGSEAYLGWIRENVAG